MKIDYWCCNCLMYRALDLQGKCAACQSEAVIPEPGDVEATYLPEAPAISPFVLARAITGGVAVLGIIFAIWWMLEGMPKWVH